MPNRNKEWAKACETEIERLQDINAELLAALEAVSNELEGFDGISAGGRKVHFSASARQALKVGRAAIAKAKNK